MAAPPPLSTAPAGAGAPASPYAKALAAQQGVALDGIVGTGPGGRIIAADVLEFAAKPAVAAPAAGSSASAVPAGEAYVDIPNSNIKKVTAKRMVQSKNEAPHYYLTMEVGMDAVMALRAEVNSAQDTKTSVNDYVIKAVAKALGEVPECNTSWTDDYVRQFASADISVAVNTDRGLITPIVFSADTKKITEIASDVQTLAGKAKDGKLQPNEFMGGTFTVSNLGSYGIKQFTAIINMPQVGSARPTQRPRRPQHAAMPTATRRTATPTATRAPTARAHALFASLHIHLAHTLSSSSSHRSSSP